MKNCSKLFLASLLSVAVLTSCGSDSKSKEGNKAVAFVTLSESYVKLEVGESCWLVPSVVLEEGHDDAEYDTQWVNSNPYVATVSEDGVITALSAGDTVISYVAGHEMAYCQIHVPGEGDEPIKPDPGPIPPGPIPPTPGPDDDDEDMECTVYFFIDYNNIDENDTTGTKLLAKFKWYGDKPLSESGKVPANPTTGLDPAFPYFIGWSNHTIIDSKDDLWDINNGLIGNGYYFYLYGIWSDVSAGEFVK